MSRNVEALLLGLVIAALGITILSIPTTEPDVNIAHLVARSPLVCSIEWVEDGQTLGAGCEVRS